MGLNIKLHNGKENKEGGNRRQVRHQVRCHPQKDRQEIRSHQKLSTFHPSPARSALNVRPSASGNASRLAERSPVAHGPLTRPLLSLPRPTSTVSADSVRSPSRISDEALVMEIL